MFAVVKMLTAGSSKVTVFEELNFLCKLKNHILHLHTVRLFTEGDDTRGCGDTICPPKDEQRAARNMLRIVV